MTDLSQPGSAPPARRAGSGPTVLIVEDEDSLRSAIRRLRPSPPIIFMSGFTAQLMDMRLVSPHLAFLPKPFRNDHLLATIRSRLEPTT